ncbi:hypothetical protein FACS1894151_01130 [Spirochaetia bacterium]|nr:hypothetical protein FACS1894151_01130 [Spirochaetia bacterium]
MENRFKFVKFGKNDENYQITCDLIKYRLICKEAEKKSTGYKQYSDLNELNTAVDEIKNKWENLGFEFVDEGFYGNSDAMTLEMLFNIAENPKTKSIKRKKL